MEKKNENHPMQYEFSAGTMTYEGLDHFPRQIDSLNRVYIQLDYKNDKEGLVSLWHLYILSLCTFLEGLLRTSYKSYSMRNYNNITDAQHHNLLAESLKVLEGLTWEKLKQSASLYLEEPLPKEFKESSCYKSVNILFALRNLLIHGNDFEVEIIDSHLGMRYEVSGKAKEVYDYLLEKKLLMPEEIQNINHYELNAKAVHFFIKESIHFTEIYLKFLSAKSDFDYYKYYNDRDLFKINYDVLVKKA